MMVLWVVNGIAQLKNEWTNVAIKGGGYITGLIIHPKEESLVYARVDIGGFYHYTESNMPWIGFYRWNQSNSRWDSIKCSYDNAGPDYFRGQSLALDPKDPDVVYIATGSSYSQKRIFKSTNRGETWTETNSGSAFHGGGELPLAGERFAISPFDPRLIQEEPLSQDYEVWINGNKVIAHTARVQDPPWDKTLLDHGGTYSFTSFDVSGPMEVKIRSIKVGNGYRKTFNNLVIRPDTLRIKNLAYGNNDISFTLGAPQKLSIEPVGKDGPLLIFANPPNEVAVQKRHRDFIYFGPGIHKPDSARITLKDNQTLYLDENAVVKAGVVVSGNHVTICGRGILCGNDFVWRKGARRMVDITGNNVVVKDIIIRGSATSNISIRNCSDVVIDNVKILGGRAQNDDGIVPINAQDVSIKNCFVRTDDDCIAVKGLQSPPYTTNTERITVENTVLWNDKAQAFRIGTESRAAYMKDLKFQDIDVIHYGHHAFVLEPGEEMKMQNVLFKNIRVHGNGQDDLIRLRPAVNHWMVKQVPGYASDITFENISVSGIAGKYRIWLAGADEKHNVSGVTLSGISVLGNRIMRGSQYLQIDNYVYGVSIK